MALKKKRNIQLNYLSKVKVKQTVSNKEHTTNTLCKSITKGCALEKKLNLELRRTMQNEIVNKGIIKLWVNIKQALTE